MKTENETKQNGKTEEAPKVELGLQIRTFDGEVKEEKDKAGNVTKAAVKYKYDRIVLPWSRTGEDVNKEKPKGAVPKLAQVLEYLQSKDGGLGLTMEFELTKDGNPENVITVTGLLIDGVNQFLNKSARTASENTKESVKEKNIQITMSRMNLSREAAIELMREMFA